MAIDAESLSQIRDCAAARVGPVLKQKLPAETSWSMVSIRTITLRNLISMNVPEDREYTRSHEWILMDDASAVVGLAANDPAGAGEIERIELPQAGSAVKVGDSVATVVFSNATRPVCAPLSGSIIEVNRDLESHPELLKQDPYGAGWLFRLGVEAGEEIEHLLSSAAYRKQLRAAEAMDIEVP